MRKILEGLDTQSCTHSPSGSVSTIATAGAPPGAPGSRGLPSPDPGQGLAAPDPAPEGRRPTAGEEGPARPGWPSAKERKRKRGAKSRQLHFWITPADKERVEVLAAAAGLSVSEYLLKRALDQGIRAKLDELAVYQLERIGRNLNQAIRHMNKGNYSEDVQHSLRRCLLLLDEQMQRLAGNG